MRCPRGDNQPQRSQPGVKRSLVSSVTCGKRFRCFRSTQHSTSIEFPIVFLLLPSSSSIIRRRRRRRRRRSKVTDWPTSNEKESQRMLPQAITMLYQSPISLNHQLRCRLMVNRLIISLFHYVLLSMNMKRDDAGSKVVCYPSQLELLSSSGR